MNNLERNSYTSPGLRARAWTAALFLVSLGLMQAAWPASPGLPITEDFADTTLRDNTNIFLDDVIGSGSRSGQADKRHFNDGVGYPWEAVAGVQRNSFLSRTFFSCSLAFNFRLSRRNLVWGGAL
jgi:hypothetical protein